jgi:hypothetical protein
MTNLMQQSAQRDGHGLFAHATGGALNLLKCFWYGIQWYYTDTGIPPRMRKIQADDPTIGVSPGEDPSCTHSIKRAEVTKGMRTLGIRLAPNGGSVMVITTIQAPHAGESHLDAGPPQDSPTQPRGCCHRIPRYPLTNEAQIVLSWSDVLLEETMQQASTSPIPCSNIPVQNGYQPHDGNRSTGQLHSRQYECNPT